MSFLKPKKARWYPKLDNRRVREALQRAGQAQVDAEEYRLESLRALEHGEGSDDKAVQWHNENPWVSHHRRTAPPRRREATRQRHYENAYATTTRSMDSANHSYQRRQGAEDNLFRQRAREKLRLILP